MSARVSWFLALPVLMAGIGVGSAWAQPAGGNEEDKAALAKNAEAFVEAFQKGDARALAGFWTPDGNYTDQTDNRLKGREAIEKAFRGLFAENKGLKLRIDSDALRFVTPDVAVEERLHEYIASRPAGELPTVGQRLDWPPDSFAPGVRVERAEVTVCEVQGIGAFAREVDRGT